MGFNRQVTKIIRRTARQFVHYERLRANTCSGGARTASFFLDPTRGALISALHFGDLQTADSFLAARRTKRKHEQESTRIPNFDRYSLKYQLYQWIGKDSTPQFDKHDVVEQTS